MLLAGTILVFIPVNQNSHSTGEALLTSLVLLAPVWAVVAFCCWALLRASRMSDASQRRWFDLLGLVVALPGLTALVVGTFTALMTRDLTVAYPDTFPWLAPMAQLGWGLLAIGMLLSLLVSVVALVLRRWRPAALAALSGITRPPLWGVGAAVWAYLVLISVFGAQALLSRDVLLAWYTPSQSTIWDAWRSMVIWIGVLLGMMFVTLLPTIILRLAGRRR
jgi:uncharacterized membrane protein YhaH (DUF805 family)